MNQATLPIPYSSDKQDDQDSDTEEYQVDSISTVSCHDDLNRDDHVAGGVIAVPDQSTLPYFGSVSVVNSNDIHFGNKTVYKGPVTIKQIVYPNGDILSESTEGLNSGGNKGSKCGVDNPNFMKEDCNNKHAFDEKVVTENNNSETLSRFQKAILDIKPEDLRVSFLAGVANLAAVCLSIGYFTAASVHYSIANGFKNLLAIAAVTDVGFKKAATIKEYIKGSSKFASAAAPSAAPAAATPEAKNEKKEESESKDDDMGFGLFD